MKVKNCSKVADSYISLHVLILIIAVEQWFCLDQGAQDAKKAKLYGKFGKEIVSAYVTLFATC